MRKPEGLFFLIWGLATLFASLVVSYMSLVQQATFSGVFWVLVPVLGLVATLLLLKHYKASYAIFGEARHSVSSLWMFIGPGIGLVGFDSVSPLVSKLVVLGIGIAVTGRLVHHRMTIYVGIITAFSSIALYQIPLLYQPIVFGVATLVAMSIPGLAFIFSPLNKIVAEQPSQDAE